MNAEFLRTAATDPEAFEDGLLVPSPNGPQRFGMIKAAFQAEWLAAINPALVAVANGVKPNVGRAWIEASKGCAKTTILAMIVLWAVAFSRRRLTIQVGAADQDQAAELRKVADDLLQLNPFLRDRVVIDKWQIKCAATGTECDILAADVAGSHGARPDILILDELVHIQRETFAQNLIDNSLKRGGLGLVLVATNAGQVGTWQWKWREIARQSAKWSFHQWAEPSPIIDKADLAEAEQRNSKARFLRLFWGVWSTGGDFLDGEDIQAAILQAAHDQVPAPGFMLGPNNDHNFIGSLDLGIKHDHSAFVVLANHGKTQRVRLATETSWAPSFLRKEIDLQAVEDHVWLASQQWNLRAVYYDPHQAALMAQRLRTRGVNMVEVPFTGANLDRMASTLLEAFRSRRVEIPACSALVSQLGKLTVVEKSYGMRLEFPRDKSGHCDIATAYAMALPHALERTGHGGNIIELTCPLVSRAPFTHTFFN